jgi:hypothetical protein
MKATLDGLLSSAFNPNDLTMYKTDGPLRKLKILSEHWVNKAKEADEKCAPSEAVDSSSDNIAAVRHPFTVSNRANMLRRSEPLTVSSRSREPLRLNVPSNSTPVARPVVSKNPQVDILNRRANTGRRFKYDNGVSQGNRNRKLISMREEIQASSEVERMLGGLRTNVSRLAAAQEQASMVVEQHQEKEKTPKKNSRKKSPKRKSPTVKDKTEETVIDDKVTFKTPSPVKTPKKITPQVSTSNFQSPPKSPLLTTPVISSPLKSRKNLLKSKIPMKKSSSQMSNNLSMPDFLNTDEDVKKKLGAMTQGTNEDMANKGIAGPIANAINSAGLSLDSLVTNDEWMKNLMDIFEDFNEENDDKADQYRLDEEPPPSNSSSRLAIDDESPMTTPPHIPQEVLEHDHSVQAAKKIHISPDKSSEGLAISRVVEELNQKQSKEEALGTQIEAQLESRLQQSDAEEEIQSDLEIEAQIEIQTEHDSPGNSPKKPVRNISEPVANESPLQQEKTPIKVNTPPKNVQVDIQQAMEVAKEASPEKISGAAISEGFMANLAAEYENVETIGFIEASAVPDVINGPKVVPPHPDRHQPKEELRRSTRQRRPNQQFEEVHKPKKPRQIKKKQANLPKEFNWECDQVPMIGATMSTLVKAEIRNLQLVTHLTDAEEVSVTCYLKHFLEASVVTSTNIDEAVSSGVDLQAVSLNNQDILNQILTSGNTAFTFEIHPPSPNKNSSPSKILRENVIEDSLEQAIIASAAANIASRDESLEQILIHAAEDAQEATSLKTMSPLKAPMRALTKEDSIENAAIMAAQGSLLMKSPPAKNMTQSPRNEDSMNRLWKTPTKTSLGIKTPSNRHEDSMSGLWKTPTKTSLGIKTPINRQEESMSGLWKTPTKTSSLLKTPTMMSRSPRNNEDSLSCGLWKTPTKTSLKKTPIKALRDHMTEDSMENAYSAVFKTPRKDGQDKGLEKAANAAKSLMRSPSFQKAVLKRSPMPSPFLGLGSPGTPSKDISIHSLSFNHNSEGMFTPSVQVDQSLTLEMSPDELRTPSPNCSGGNNSDGPLTTPPLESGIAKDDSYGHNGSLGGPRTPRTPRGGASRHVENLIMSSPLKVLNDAAKKLFFSEGNTKTTLVFISPSKRIPRRAVLAPATPMKQGQLSSWEAQHDVNNLDHYQSKVKEAPEADKRTTDYSDCSKKKKRRRESATSKKANEQPAELGQVLSLEAQHGNVNNLDHDQSKVKVAPEADTSDGSKKKKRKASATSSKKAFEQQPPAKKLKIKQQPPRTPGKTVKFLVTPPQLEQPQFDVNMELVPQLRTTPRKPTPPPAAKTVAETASDESSIHNALGLVPKTPELQHAFVTPIKTPRTPKTPRSERASKRQKMKKVEAVQRNLFEDEVVSTVVIPASPAKFANKNSALLSLTECYDLFEQEPWAE